eukprot:73535_1
MVPRQLSCTYFIAPLLFIFASCSRNELAYIDVITNQERFSGTHNASIHVTLWFNSTIYEYVLDNQSNYHTHDDDNQYTFRTYTDSSPAFQVRGSSTCNASQIATEPEAKMMIETNMNAVNFTGLKFTTSSDTSYEIGGICTKTPMPWKNHSQNWFLNDTECGESQEHYHIFCVGPGHCAPSKQIIYFDTTRPNQTITNASWVNATNTVVEIAHCDPTDPPTFEPTTGDTTSKPPSTGDNDDAEATIVIVTIIVPASLLFCACVMLLIWWIISKRYNTAEGGLMNMRELSRVFSSSKTTGNGNPSTDIVISWVKHTLELPQYVDNFVGHGYTSMEMIQNIRGKSDLHKIGIRKKGHQTFIMSEIDKVRTSGTDEPKLGLKKIDSAASSASASKSKLSMSYDVALVAWCRDVLELPQYVDQFVRYGYGSMREIKQIQRNAQLIEIGIVKRGHQVLILDEIGKLPNEVRIKHASAKKQYHEPDPEPEPGAALYGIIVAVDEDEPGLQLAEDSRDSSESAEDLYVENPTLGHLGGNKHKKQPKHARKQETTTTTTTRTAMDAMKNDPIVRGIIRTKRDMVIVNPSTRKDAPSIIQVSQTIQNAMKQDPIARGMIATDKGGVAVIRNNRFEKQNEQVKVVSNSNVNVDPVTGMLPGSDRFNRVKSQDTAIMKLFG